jgi:hypothetical protein
MKPSTTIIAIAAIFCAFQAVATDVYYSDFAVESPSKKYKVEGKSPDNAAKGPVAFQASFVYTCTDTASNHQLWSRRQPMSELKKGSGEVFPAEGSPAGIFVSDAGWTVIKTGWNELIVVDLAGHDRGRVKLLTEAFTKQERARYVVDTTAGPMWEGYALWYFLDWESAPLFVLRPWWGRRVVLNLANGKLIRETAALSKRATDYERDFVLGELAKRIKDCQKTDCESPEANIQTCNEAWPIMKACYLAGRLQMKEAIPYLEKFQESTFSNGYQSPELGASIEEVDPASERAFSLRQVAQLSLRRLGRKPKPLPLTQHYYVRNEPGEKLRPYLPKARSVPREANVDKLRKGMKALEVLDLLGEPDYHRYDGGDIWEYDMDSTAPFSLSLTWNSRKLVEIQKKRPVLWKSTLVRDAQCLP